MVAVDTPYFESLTFQLQYKELKQAILRNVPLFIDKKKEIDEMIREIPESYNGKYVCSNIRKEAYIRNMNVRMKIYFVPAYERYVKERNAG